MKFESAPKDNKSVEQSKSYANIKEQLHDLCLVHHNAADLVAVLLNKTRLLLSHIDSSLLSEGQVQTVLDGIKDCAIIDNQEVLITSLLEVLKPIIDLRTNNFSDFEAAKIESVNEAHGWQKLNQLLSYGKSGPIVHLHVPAGESVPNKREQYYQGLAKLAKIVAEDPEIQWIEETSFIVAEHPGLFIRDNFTISEVSQEFKQKHFPGEREIKKASISRDEFLNKFLPKNN